MAFDVKLPPSLIMAKVKGLGETWYCLRCGRRFTPKQVEHEVPGVGVGGNQLADLNFLSVKELNRKGFPLFDDNFLDLSVGPDLPMMGFEKPGQRQRKIAHATLYDVVPKVLNDHREEPGHVPASNVIRRSSSVHRPGPRQNLGLFSLEHFVAP